MGDWKRVQVLGWEAAWEKQEGRDRVVQHVGNGRREEVWPEWPRGASAGPGEGRGSVDVDMETM